MQFQSITKRSIAAQRGRRHFSACSNGGQPMVQVRVEGMAIAFQTRGGGVAAMRFAVIRANATSRMARAAR